MANDEAVLKRREVLVGIGVAAVAAAGVVARLPALMPSGVSVSEALDSSAAASTASGQAGPSVGPLVMPARSDDVEALFRSARTGSSLRLEGVEDRWDVISVHGVRNGAIPVVLATSAGDRFAVEVFRDTPDGAATPIARAEGLALFLVNGGSGSTPTEEVQGRGVMALRRALAAARRDGAAVPAALQTRDARTASMSSHLFPLA